MLLTRIATRLLARHPWQTVLSILGIALGVAVVIAIDLANESARRAFQIANRTVAGHATHSIVGGPRGVPESLYPTLRIQHRLRHSAPVVEGRVAVAPSGELFRLLGVDPFAEAALRSYAQGGSEWSPVRLLSEPRAALLLDRTAQRLGLHPSDELTVRVGDSTWSLRLVGVIHPADPLQAQALRTVLIADISIAQELLHMPGRLSRIDVALAPGADPSADAIASLLPAGVDLVTVAGRGRALEQMTEAFRINLTALSLLALVVGMFLIYNAMTIAVLQRRALIATLRTLGVSRRQVFGWVCGEALAVGAIGTLLGATLGVALSHYLLALVTQTINDLYFVIEVSAPHLSPVSLVKGATLGLGATVAATLAPAVEATRVPPQMTFSRSRLERAAHRSSPLLAAAGLAAAGGAALVLALSRTSLLAGFVGLFLIILAFAAITPLGLAALVGGLRPLLVRTQGLIGGMAARGVLASLSRTRVAVAALAVAVAAAIGVGVMIASFRATVAHWLANYLRADVYVSQSDSRVASGIDPGLIERVAALPEVAAVTRGRRVRLQGAAEPTELFAVDLDANAFAGFQFKHGDRDAVWADFRSRDIVIVSEPYAYRHGVGVGDTIALRTESGPRAFRVGGVYYDYGSDRGVVVLHRDTYRRHWHDPVISSFAIYLRPQTDVDGFLERLHHSALHGTTLEARSNRRIRELSLEIFDRTFAITNVLRLLAIVIAVIGIFSALMAIQLERAREFAVLRANGVTPRQLLRLVVTESGIMGLAAGVLAAPLGLILAETLIHVINRRAFGWTMQFSLAPEPLISGVALALLAGMAAGVYPGRRLSRTPPARALRYE